ncbi:SulP family inorganic anion transporter [Sporichthya brevicatena]|uniref:SulP family inorganic anion transporter n=1 Tax=Sporichthya brevicatena TaxID=171442 RepID=A0ABN1H6P6_9ACTN
MFRPAESVAPPWWRGYRRADLRHDVPAGVTVAAYLIPQVMAYAQVAGLPPAAGLWAAVAALTVYAVLGSSRQLSVGPESTTALMTAAALGPLAAGSPDRYAALAVLLAAMVGTICLIASAARLGALADLLSKPVLVGYLAGVAVLMTVGQLKNVTRTPIEGESIAEQLDSWWRHRADFHGPTLTLAAAVLVLMIALQRWRPQVPGALVAVLGATAVVALFDLDRHGIAVVGSLPGAPASPDLGLIEGDDVRLLIAPAIGLAVVGFTDNVLTARAFASRRNQTIAGGRELTALGAANLGAAAAGGFPVSSSGSRTALGDAVGSRTQFHSLAAAATVVLTLVLLRDVLADFPVAALGALVLYAAVRLIEIGEFRYLNRFRRSELLLALATTAAVLTLGVRDGILAAVVLSLADLLRRVARPHDAVQGFVPGLAGMHDVADYPDAETVPGLLVYRYDSPLFFANAENFHRRLLDAYRGAEPPPRWVVLNVEAMVEIDVTAAEVLARLHTELKAQGVVLAMAQVKQDLRRDLDASGLTDRIGADHLFPTLPTAVAAFQNHP